MEIVLIDNLNTRDAKLLDAAQSAAIHAYAPYSNFRVGAALRTRSGNTFAGSNSENAAITGVHAEVAACVAAQGSGDSEIISLAVAPELTGKSTAGLVTPCGICRQHIFEFSQQHGVDIQIICGSFDRKTVGITTISQLLPYPFGPKEVLGY